MDLGKLVAFLTIDDSGLEQGTKRSEGRLKSWAAGAAKITAAAGVAAGAAFGTSLAAAMDAEAATDKLAASLDLSGREAARAGTVAANLYKGAWGESLDETNAAVGAVMSSFKGMRTASAKDLEALTIKAMDLSAAMEIDISRASQVAGQWVKNGLAKDATEAMDLLTAGLQKVPAAVREDVVDAMDEYGPFMKSLGLTGSEAMEMLVKQSAKGMYGIDKAGDALKEFTLKATDGSKNTATALEYLGLNFRDIETQIAGGGPAAGKAFGQVVDSLLKIKNPADQAQAAIALFGTPLEDLNVSEIPKFLKGMQTGTGAMDGYGGAAERMGKKLNGNAKSSITSLTRSVKMWAIGLATDAIPVVMRVVKWAQDHLAPALSKVGKRLRSDVIPAVKDAAKWLGDKLLPPARKIANQITDDLLPALAGLWEAYKDDLAKGFGVLEGAVDKVVDALEKVVPIITSVVEWMSDNSDIVWAVIAAYATYKAVTLTITAITWAMAAAQGALNLVMSLNPIGLLVAAVVGLVLGLVILYKRSDKVREIVDILWEGMKKFGGWVAGVFIGGIRGIGKAFNWVREKIAGAWGWVKSHWPLLLAIITGPIGLAVLAITKNWDKIKSGAKKTKEWVTEKFGDLLAWVKKLPGRMATAVAGLWDGFTSGFKTAINGIIGLWNSVDFGISITVPDWVPGVGGKGFKVDDVFPDIPELAKGGVIPATPGGTIARLAEVGQTEFAVPEPAMRKMIREAVTTGRQAGPAPAQTAQADAASLDRAAARLADALLRKMEDAAEGVAAGVRDMASVGARAGWSV